MIEFTGLSESEWRRVFSNLDEETFAKVKALIDELDRQQNEELEK